MAWRIHVGSGTICVFPEPTATIQAKNIPEYFDGVEVLYLPPQSVTTLASALSERFINTLIIFAEPFRISNKVVIRVWKIQGIWDGSTRRKNIITRNPAPDAQITLTLFLSEIEREAILFEILQHAKDGMEFKLVS